MATVTRTFELSEEAIERLQDLAAVYDLTPDAMLEGILNPPAVELTAEQYQEIDEALADLDANGPAPQEEVDAFFQSVLKK